MRRVAPAFALFFLSPLVAEFLLGDFTLAQLPFLIALAPAYGGAALLIRELTRRTGRGWPSMILLALAYGVIEEGLETQSLFNPDYLGVHLLDHGFVPALGIAVPWTVLVLTIHTVWSVSVPIALVEEWGTRRTVPWLRLPGLIVTAVLAVAGGLFTFVISYADGHFLAHPAQLIVTALVAAALIVTAFRLPRGAASPGPLPAAGAISATGQAGSPSGTGTDAAGSSFLAATGSAGSRSAAAAGLVGMPAGSAAGPVGSPAGWRKVIGAAVPAPWMVLVMVLVAGGLFLAASDLPAVPGVLLALVVLGAVATAIMHWSESCAWDGRHRLAAAGGALLTYAWHSFMMHPVIEASTALIIVSHVVVALAAVLLLGFEVRRVWARYETPAEPELVPASEM